MAAHHTIDLAGALTVGRLGFGAMRITGAGSGEPEDRQESKRLLTRAVELGVDFIDTADFYGPHESERLIGEALAPYPDGLVVATKGGAVQLEQGRWRPDGSPEHLKRACEGSLLRLRIDTIDLYQLHIVDPKVPYEESIGALRDLRDEGKVRFIGISNVDTKLLEQARGIVDIASVQNNYSITQRDSEDVLVACEKASIAFLPWHPMARGDLARPGGPLDQVAKEHDATPGQVALAWLLHRSPVMLPIPGTSSVAHLEENIAARDLELSDEDFAAIEAAVEAA